MNRTQPMSLAQAIIQERPDWVRAMLDAGVDVNQVDEYGFTPLIEAGIADNTEIARMLLENGADVEATDMVGGTALHWAVDNKNLELCKLLLESGMDPNLYMRSSESPIVKAILSRQRDIQRLLFEHGANEQFARDFINTKLLGHRFELRGHVDILDPKGRFNEVNYEGFFPKFTIGMINDSLISYMQNYAARGQVDHFAHVAVAAEMLQDAQKILSYQNYLLKREKHQAELRRLFEASRVILPVVFEGHVISIMRFDKYIVFCDRRKTNNFFNGISIFELGKPQAWTAELCDFLCFEKKNTEYIEKELPRRLGLKLVGRLMIEPQMTGNCSWANIEACLPAIVFLLTDNPRNYLNGIVDYDHDAITIYRHWREWDKQRALHLLFQNYEQADLPRQASMAALMAAIFFQRLDSRRREDVDLASRIYPIINRPEFKYLLSSYKSIYIHRENTKAGDNLERLIAIASAVT